MHCLAFEHRGLDDLLAETRDTTARVTFPNLGLYRKIFSGQEHRFNRLFYQIMTTRTKTLAPSAGHSSSSSSNNSPATNNSSSDYFKLATAAAAPPGTHNERAAAAAASQNGQRRHFENDQSGIRPPPLSELQAGETQKSRQICLPLWLFLGILTHGSLFMEKLMPKLREKKEASASLCLANFEIEDYTGYSMKKENAIVQLHLKLSVFYGELFLDLRYLLFRQPHHDKDDASLTTTSASLISTAPPNGWSKRSLGLPICTINGINLRYTDALAFISSLSQWINWGDKEVIDAMDQFRKDVYHLNPLWKQFALSTGPAAFVDQLNSRMTRNSTTKPTSDEEDTKTDNSSDNMSDGHSGVGTRPKPRIL